MRFLILVLSLAAGQAQADNGCHDLWFTRNLVMDRAGYCFGSVLGRAVFDNSDCTGKEVSLDAPTREFVAQIRGLEEQHSCRVDTGQPVLDLIDRQLRQSMVTLPIRDEFESGCLNWIGPVTPLRSGAGATAPVVGQIAQGDYVLYSHLPVGNWIYATTWSDNWQALKGAGWLPVDATTTGNCRDFAG